MYLSAAGPPCTLLSILSGDSRLMDGSQNPRKGPVRGSTHPYQKADAGTGSPNFEQEERF